MNYIVEIRERETDRILASWKLPNQSMADSYIAKRCGNNPNLYAIMDVR